jgi:preprotein translocase subunit SecG
MLWARRKFPPAFIGVSRPMPLLVRFTLGFMLVFMALFLIALVLIQRGRGGGLAGAFGGAGGQSAFGTKAGDLFTRITVVVAAIWILLCILAVNVLGTSRTRLAPTLGGAAATAPGGEAADTTMEPVEPETKPAEPETKPAEPETKPAASEAAPAEPETKPAAPAAE